MPSYQSLLSSLSCYVSARGGHLSGRQALARWAAGEPSLAGFSHLGEVVSACREGPPGDQDALVRALLRVAGNDQLAQLAVVSALSKRLGTAISTWRRGGASPSELAVMQADLVTGCWLAVAGAGARAAAGDPPPERPGLVLVDQARAYVRSPRRRELRASARSMTLEEAPEPVAGDDRTVAERLAGELLAAVRAGRITASAAGPVFLTRVAGLSTAEAARRLGCSPATLRAERSRPKRRLVG